MYKFRLDIASMKFWSNTLISHESATNYPARKDCTDSLRTLTLLSFGLHSSEECLEANLSSSTLSYLDRFAKRKKWFFQGILLSWVPHGGRKDKHACYTRILETDAGIGGIKFLGGIGGLMRTGLLSFASTTTTSEVRKDLATTAACSMQHLTTFDGSNIPAAIKSS